MNNKRMKKYFKPFFDEHKFMLIIASIGLSVPLIVRGILDFYRINENFEKARSKKQGVYDTLFYLIGDLIPLSL